MLRRYLLCVAVLAASLLTCHAVNDGKVGHPVPTDWRIALWHSVLNGNIGGIEEAIANGADVNYPYPGGNLLHAIVMTVFGYETLERNGAPSQALPQRPDYITIIRILVHHHINVNFVNAQGRTPLGMATATGLVAIAEELRAHGAVGGMPVLPQLQNPVFGRAATTLAFGLSSL